VTLLKHKAHIINSSKGIFDKVDLKDRLEKVMQNTSPAYQSHRFINRRHLACQHPRLEVQFLVW
jgi:hypothetical protein